jgi:hypothetical protein
MIGSVMPLRKYYFLSKYLAEVNEGPKLVYAFKGGLTQIELNAGSYMLEEFRKTPRRLALLPVGFIVVEFFKTVYNKFKKS